MTEAATEVTPTGPVTEQAAATDPSALVTDVLVEEVSIDGMCGVY